MNNCKFKLGSIALLSLPLALLIGCLSTQTRKEYDDLVQKLRMIEMERALNLPLVQDKFDEELRVDDLVRFAIANNPEMDEARFKVYAAVARFHAAVSLDDLHIRLIAEAIPLRQPFAFNRSEANMISLGQMLPFFGKLDIKGQIALKEADSALQMYRAEERKLREKVVKAYYEYLLAYLERKIHNEHVELHQEHVRIADIKYKTGKGIQQDVVRSQLELTMLHNDVIIIDQKIESARTMLNSLLNRKQEKFFADPELTQFKELNIDLEKLYVRVLQERPEIKAMEAMVKASEKEVDMAKADQTQPDIMLGADYWQMGRRPDGWGGMMEFNLPWLNPRHSAIVREKSAILASQKSALHAMKNMTMASLRDAVARLFAAEKSVLLYESTLLPQAEQSVKTARSGYEKGQIDFLTLNTAQVELRMHKINYQKTRVEYEIQKAELERLAGRIE